MTDYCVCCGVFVPEGRFVCPICERAATSHADRKDAICDYLKKHHTGKKNAVPSKELEQRFALDGRTIRRKINQLRQDGHPICSDQTGYYYAASQHEINRTIGRLNGLVTGVSNARTGLLYATPKEEDDDEIEIILCISHRSV